MTPLHEQHLEQLKSSLLAKMDTKYRVGQAEHGGQLWERNCLAEALPEAIDLFTYLQTAITNQETAAIKLRHCISMLDKYDPQNIRVELQQVLRLLLGKDC